MPRNQVSLIVDVPAQGTWNMAVDEALLESAVDNGVATLRLYQWSEPTLSLGYFQQVEDRNTHAASRDCAVVRRQSGGGAILHDRELTYSLALPADHPLTRDPTALYTAIHQSIVQLLAPRMTPHSASQWRLTLNSCPSQLAASDEPFLCFQRRACGDVLLESIERPATNSAPQTYKILGSAQRRHRGAILQHGSFLVAQSPAAPELPGWQELTGEIVEFEALVADTVRQLCGLLEFAPTPSELTESARERAKTIEQNRYSSRSWTARR
jgi:lipoate-protein ligase A